MSDTATRAVSSSEHGVGVAYEDINTNSRPAAIRIPDTARAVSATHWSQMAASNALTEGAASVVGVSIGREQTRMTSPTTPAAEKSAALDRMNNYGFFDNTDEDAEKLADIQEDDRKAQTRQPDQPSGLPSPWIAGPQIHVEEKNRNRSRAGSLFSGSIPSLPSLPSMPDLNMKQMWRDFNPPSLSDAFGKLAPMASFKDAASTTKRPSRSNSLFANRVSWNTNIRKDGSASPRRGTGTGNLSGQRTPIMMANRPTLTPENSSHSPKSGSPERNSSPATTNAKSTNDTTPEATTPTGLTPFPALQTDGTGEQGTKAPPARPRPQLRRSASDTSMLSRTSTVYSFDADPDQFSHIDSMVNSRFKAVKDSWQDSSFRLKNVTGSTRRLSFKPDFLKGSEDSSGSSYSRALSSIFSDESSQHTRTRSLTPPGPAVSPKLSRHPTLDKALDQITGDLLIMGGYRGSILRSAEDSRQLWVPFKVGLHMRKVNLEVGLNPEDEETEHTRIYSSGILSHIGPIDISRRLIRRIKHSDSVRSGRVRFHDYGYDWRLSPEFLGRQLIRYVEKLQCNQPDTPPEQRGVTIIAHSLGGLITRWAINQRPELFAGVVYAGTPQHCVNIIGPLRNGDDVLLSSKVLTAQVNFTLRTSYALLPESGRCFIDKETREEYPVNFFDAKDWEENSFSPVIAPVLPALSQDRKSGILTRLLDSTPSLVSQSFSSLPDDRSNSSPAIPASSPVSQTNSTASPVRAAQDTVERKAAGASHPHQNAFNPSMSQPAVRGPATDVTIPRDRAMAYLQRTLTETLRFKQALAHQDALEHANRYPPAAVLYATSVPTVYGAQVSGRDGIRRADAYDSLVFAAGDGVVLARAAMLPKGYRLAEGGRVLTDRGHVGLLGDLEATGKCLWAVVQARRGGVGLGEKAASQDEKREKAPVS